MGLTKADAYRLLIPGILGVGYTILLGKVPQYPWLEQLLLGAAAGSFVWVLLRNMHTVGRVTLGLLALLSPWIAPWAWPRLVSFLMSPKPVWKTSLVVLAVVVVVGGIAWFVRLINQADPLPLRNYVSDSFLEVKWVWNWSGAMPIHLTPRCPKCDMVLHLRSSTLYPRSNALKPAPTQVVSGSEAARYILAYPGETRVNVYLDCDDCKEHYPVREPAISDGPSLEDYILRKIDQKLHSATTEQEGSGSGINR